MSEETPFQSMRITLSDDAVTKLEFIKEKGRFRSYSNAIEEIIRVMYELIPIYTIVYETRGRKKKFTYDALELIIDRSIAYLYRFTSKQVGKGVGK